MSVTRRYTSADLARLPHVEGGRYEIIDGELHVSTQPRVEHQYACSQLVGALVFWSQRTGRGIPIIAPGLVFAPDQDVAPDLVWISHARLATALDAGGHLRDAPELVVEVLSPGAANERRDREQKLALYERHGVQEYWIVDSRGRRVEVYRRAESGFAAAATLAGEDMLTTPLLPGFACHLPSLWAPPV